MDVSLYLELKTAPRAVLDSAEKNSAHPRFMLPEKDGWRSVSRGAFAHEIGRVALALRALGLRSTESVAIFADNRAEWLSAALGIQAAGGVMVPIYPASTAAQAAYVVEHSDARVVFVDARAFERVREAWDRYRGVEHFVVFPEGEGQAEPRVLAWSQLTELGAHDQLDTLLAGVDLDQPALMLYTSGTTGDPKGVPLTHRNIALNWCDWLACNASLLKEDAIDLLWLPFSHIFGFGEACLGNLLGFTSYLSDPQHVLGHLPQVRPDVLMSVPAYWEKIAGAVADEPDAALRKQKLLEITGGRLSFCLSGGAGLKRQVKELFYECGLLIIEGYGLTECSPTLTLNRPDDFRFDSVGKPLPSVELRLAPEDGEILARGPNVFAGYHKNPEATREAFTDDGWFKTGDVGRFTEDGFLQIVDRKKEILVTAGGKNVPPANIELRFAGDSIFRHVVVYGDGKKYLTAGVWLDPEAVDARLRGTPAHERARAIDALVQAGIDRVNGELARFEQIRRYCLMDVPLTVAGGLLTSTLKVRRKKVYEAFRATFEALYQEPRP